jgi:hypothetical protein
MGYTMRRLGLVALMALVFAACEDDASGPEDVQIEGEYILQTINGRPMPVLIFNLPIGFYQVHQTGGTFSLTADHRYEERAMVRETYYDSLSQLVTEDTTQVFRGTWEAEDSVLIVTETGSDNVGFGVVNGNRLTLSFEFGDSLFTYVYLRSQRLTSSLSSTTRRRTTTSSMTGLRSMTVSSTTPLSPLASRILPYLTSRASSESSTVSPR